MRHNRRDKRFSRPSGHFRCMMSNLTRSLILNGRISTTLPRAKELRRHTERMITLGKAGDAAARRRAFGFLRDKSAIAKLFSELAPLYKERSGGYTRILKTANRPGDCAAMSIIELVEGAGAAKTEEKPPEKAGKKTERKTKKAVAAG